jgi:hypothetical protein
MTERGTIPETANTRGEGPTARGRFHEIDAGLHKLRAEAVELRKQFNQQTRHEDRESFRQFNSKIERVALAIDQAVRTLRSIR